MIEFIELIAIPVIYIAVVAYVLSMKTRMSLPEVLEEIRKMHEKEKRHAEMRKALGLDEDDNK